MPVNLLLVALGVVLNVSAQIAIKWAVQGSGQLSLADVGTLARLCVNPAIILGLVLYALSVVNWMVVLSRLDLGVAYPAMSVGYVISYLAGVWLFHEPVSGVRIAGILIIILGVVLLTRPVAGAVHG